MRSTSHPATFAASTISASHDSVATARLAPTVFPRALRNVTSEGATAAKLVRLAAGVRSWKHLVLAALAGACGPSLPSGAMGDGASSGLGASSGATEEDTGTGATDAELECEVPQEAELLFLERFGETWTSPISNFISPRADYVHEVEPDLLWVLSRSGIVELSPGKEPRVVGGQHVDASGPPGLFSVDYRDDWEAAHVDRVAMEDGSVTPFATIDLPDTTWWELGLPPIASVAVDASRVIVFVAARAPAGGVYVFDAVTAKQTAFVPLDSERPTGHVAGIVWTWRDSMGRMSFVGDDGFAHVWVRREAQDAIVELDLDALEHHAVYTSPELVDFAVTATHIYAAGIEGLTAIDRDTGRQDIVALKVDRVIPSGDGVIAIGQAEDAGASVAYRIDAATPPVPLAELYATVFDVFGGRLIWTTHCLELLTESCDLLSGQGCEFEVTRSVWRL